MLGTGLIREEESDRLINCRNKNTPNTASDSTRASLEPCNTSTPPAIVTAPATINPPAAGGGSLIKSDARLTNPSSMFADPSTIRRTPATLVVHRAVPFAVRTW